MNANNPETRPGIFRQAAERFRSGLESNLLETSHSLSSKIRGLIHEDQKGFINRSRLAWIGAVTTVWTVSGFAVFEGSYLVTQGDPAASGIGLLSSVLGAFIATSIANELLLYKIENI